MSDNKLKSENGKPASRKPAEEKAPAVPKSASKTKKTAAASSKATTANRKIKTTKPLTEKPSVAKADDKKIQKAAKSVKSHPQKNTKKTETTEPLSTSDTKVSSINTKDNKTKSAPLTTKPENGSISRPSKNRSFGKMATVAAVLFLGVLFVFLKGYDPASEEEQDSAKATSTQIEAPNPNASSPYGMRVEQLKEIEILLASLNLDPGNIDGNIDHESVAAISLFQEISGLQVDGRPTPDLLVDLKAVEQLLKVE